MDLLRITGDTPLTGTVTAGGSKNAALPIMAASILATEPVLIERVPEVVDVTTLSAVLAQLGVEVKRQDDGALRIETVDSSPTRADYELVRRMRASFCVLGPLLARRRRAVVSLPGGCNLGDRPVDLHLAGLAALGAKLRIDRGYVIAEADELRGADISLLGPHGATVTGTANVMSAATLARGTTIIRGAAREPEIVDLADFLNTLGARIVGAGEATIEIVGVEHLNGGTHRVIPDRIEAATLLIAGAITGGNVHVKNARLEHLGGVLDVLDRAGAELSVSANSVSILMQNRPRPIQVTTCPYPGVPTDVQPQLTALATIAEGRSEIVEGVFPDRFMHVPELKRLGARIERAGHAAVVDGLRRLVGAELMASDLRGGAALVLAALAAEGVSLVRRIYHVDRGHEQIERKLARLGAQIERCRDQQPAKVGSS
ncbi:MAG: UDP-N-acetylglucosamine 1-carboxyvinyltransferase [Planctomycetes bacterium]|nr:UDP-N-acetylglucosamine 1-carboxyvinyltransferase [Planctomycetota bacterium]